MSVYTHSSSHHPIMKLSMTRALLVLWLATASASAAVGSSSSSGGDVPTITSTNDVVMEDKLMSSSSSSSLRGGEGEDGKVISSSSFKKSNIKREAATGPRVLLKPSISIAGNEHLGMRDHVYDAVNKEIPSPITQQLRSSSSKEDDDDGTTDYDKPVVHLSSSSFSSTQQHNTRKMTTTDTTTTESTTRIVGGNQAEVNEYPYYVEWGGCGGSLIAPDMVLTAAHCDQNNININVLVGAYRKRSETNGAVSRGIIDKATHPDYEESTRFWAYDFMLLRLSSRVRTIQPVILNFEQSIPSDYETLTVIGLGTLSSGGSSPNILMEVDLQYVPSNICNIEDAYDGNVDDTIMFCAGVDGGGKDSCQGDSGGPVVLKQGADDGTDLQVGVVSWGEGCALPDYPGVNARVSGDDGWIKDTACRVSRSGSNLCGFGGQGVGNALSNLNCLGNNLNFYLELHTDDYGKDETSWRLINDRTGTEVTSQNSFEDDSYYEYETCLPAGECYVLVLEDTYGDGLCCGGQNTGYSIRVDGQLIEKGGLDYWGATPENETGFSKEIKFGSCDTPGTSPTSAPVSSATPAPVTPAPVTPAPVVTPVTPAPVVTPTECINLSIRFTTDDFPNETYLFMKEKDSNENRWQYGQIYSYPLLKRSRYQLDDCLPTSKCWMLEFGDTLGNGLFYPGNLNVTYGTELRWNGTDIGYGITDIYGNC